MVRVEMYFFSQGSIVVVVVGGDGFDWGEMELECEDRESGVLERERRF